MKTLSTKSITVTILSGILWTFASAATAGDPAKVVDFRDLDLAQPDDVAILYERIQKAASLICREDLPPYVNQFKEYKSCFEAAVEEAVSQVNSRALTSLHQGNADQIASR